MTINFSIDDLVSGDETADLLDGAEELYQMAAIELLDALKNLKKDSQKNQIEEAKTAVQAVKDLRQAFDWVMNERNRVDKLRKSVAGAVRTSELDLDAARDEIGRRFSCLRNAGGHR